MSYFFSRLIISTNFETQVASLNITDYLATKASLIDEAMDTLIPSAGDFPKNLNKAVRHSLFAGGKRLRPVLTLASAEAVGGDSSLAINTAVALECIHTYSLIHDDLPAMDDDDLRRGRPTCHKAYGEATAILAGDSLLTIAFELIANSKNISSEKIVQIIKEVSKGAGGVGMIGGQILDIESEGTEVEFAFLEQIHSYKTGALIVASIRSGAIIGGANEAELQALSSYGRKVGLAFQIADDILNVESTAEVLGKAVGSDEEREKATYPSLVGLKESKELAAELLEGALEALTSFDEKALPLRLIAEYAVARKK